jgi:hypothetical protein
LNKHLVVLVVLLFATGCAHHVPAPLNVQRSATPVDLTAASESELRKDIGERVTMRGTFSLFGKLAPFILVSGRPIYLESKIPISLGEPYVTMQDKDVRVTGILRFAQYPEPQPGALPEGRAPDHFYIEQETAKVELDQK